MRLFARTSVGYENNRLPLCDSRADYPVPESGVIKVRYDQDSLELGQDPWSVETMKSDLMVGRRVRGGRVSVLTIHIGKGNRSHARIITEVRDERGIICAVKQAFSIR